MPIQHVRTIHLYHYPLIRMTCKYTGENYSIMVYTKLEAIIHATRMT